MPELPDPPANPPRTGDERALLTAFLDYYREVMLRKVQGVSDDDLRRIAMPPSTLTLLGILKHLAYVERWWFREAFLGQELPGPSTEEDPDADLRIEPIDRTEDIVALYREEIARANDVIAGAQLETVAADPTVKGASLRWILIHMIEETARHAGHADLIRERIDGIVGD